VAAAAVILTVLPVAGARTALALLTGRGTGTVTASTGTWAAVATTTGSPPYGPVTLTFTKAHNSPQYLWIANTGDFDLTGITTELVLSAPGTASLAICSTAWNESTGKCSGTTTVLNDGTPGGTTAALALAVGQQVRVKATAKPAKVSSFTVTVNVSVPRTLARPATTVES
jgi:hypothetical protein